MLMSLVYRGPRSLNLHVWLPISSGKEVSITSSQALT
uniref:Uncharacterized protein n=1 Tax=Brassica oleracea TaxID=3712 RepID=A0A3P6FE19_BRAOL|nr:unnamed protein product [Brassica oleracea]